MTREGNGKVYRVTVSDQIKADVRERYTQAVATGKGKPFLAALRKIHERLRHDPLSFGEPLYHLPSLQLVVYKGIVSPLVVDYGVHEEKALVIIRGVKILS
jgi:hypothetical protein